MIVFLTILVTVPYPWLDSAPQTTVAQRFPTPTGYARTPAEPGSFAAWLRGLPVRSEPTVRLFDGRVKRRQDVQVAVLDIDVGDRDLQQCADAVMRLRAEYLYSQDRESEIAFDFTSGDPARWSDWRRGLRPRVAGNEVTWTQRAATDGSYDAFRRYLTRVFAYAGSASLERQLGSVPDPRLVEPGDVFIQGGFPGHAVIVLDVAVDPRGARVFLLAQSYMPAQDIHVLKRPGADSPWYPARSSGVLATPEWTFTYSDLVRW